MVSKRFHKYYIQLPILGLCYFLSSIFFLYIFITTQEYWVISYIPFILISAFTGFILPTKIVKGGSVNYYVHVHKDNPDEVKLDKLISKYQNIKISAFAVIVFLIVEFYILFTYGTFNFKFNVNEITFLIILVTLCITVMCEGIKYMTAWWNIKQNWKKEFEK